MSPQTSLLMCGLLTWTQHSNGTPASMIGFNKGPCLIPLITIIGKNAAQRSVGCSIRGKEVLLRHKRRERCCERSGMAQASTVSVETRGSGRLLFNCFPFFRISLPFRCEPRLSLPLPPSLSLPPPFCLFCQKTALVSKACFSLIYHFLRRAPALLQRGGRNFTGCRSAGRYFNCRLQIAARFQLMTF